MYGKLLRKALLLYLNARYGDKHWYRYYQELKEIQWWSKEQLEALQLERLKALLKHAYQNVPYYHRKFTEAKLRPDDIRTLADLTKLPVLTKRDIRENRAELVARNLPSRQIINMETSGSTGEALRFLVTYESLNRGSAAAHLAYFWGGYEHGDKMVHLWYFPADKSAMQGLSRKISLRLFPNFNIDVFDMSESKMDRFARQLARYKPKLIVSYTSALYLFARYLKYRGIYNVKSEAVVTEAHKLFPEQRELIEEVFGCKVFDLYGSREMSTIAGECHQHNGYHIFTPNVVLEFVKDGQPVSPGETGEIIATNLHNYALPFIRYKSEDLGVLSDRKCQCGRGLPLMQDMTGRINDMLIGSDGKYISGHIFFAIIRNKWWARQFQVNQDKDRNITLKIVAEPHPAESELESIKQNIQQKFGDEIKIDVALVSSIKSTRTGKFRFVMSEATPPF